MVDESAPAQGMPMNSDSLLSQSKQQIENDYSMNQPPCNTSIKTPTEGVQTSGTSDPHPECVRQEQNKEETPGSGDQPQYMLSSSRSIHTDENEETIITSVCATDVAAGLRRLPAGFYTVVLHSGLQWKTENKRLLVSRDTVEWNETIPIPSDPSATVCVEVYASFEFQPMLGTGEQLRKLTTTVEQLLNRSVKDIPFTFFPNDEDVVCPCSSILVTVEQRKHESSDPSSSRVLRPHCSVTGSRGELEDATNRGHGALSRFQKHDEKRDLEHSVEEFERALSICPLEHPGRAAAQSNLAMAKLILYQAEGTNTFLEIPLHLYCNALAARPVGHLDRPRTLIQLAAVHFARLEKQWNEVEEARATSLLHEVMELGSAGSHEHRAATFMLQVHTRRKAGTVQADGQSSVERDSAPHLTDEDLGILSRQLLKRFERFGDLADLSKAVIILEELIGSTPVWDDRYHTDLANFGVALSQRFNRLGELSDLEDAISRHRAAVELTPHTHPEKPGRLHNLGISFLTRFKRLGQSTDLGHAISTLKSAADLTTRGHPHRPILLETLGNSYVTRFRFLGELSDIEDAISILKDAISLTPRSHPHRPGCLSILGNAFFSRFERLGDLGNLEDATSMYRGAIDLTPHDHPGKPGYLNSLGNTFKARFDHLGKSSDLEDSISSYRSAVNLTPHRHPEKPARLNNLGNSLKARFKLLGELSDLENAISTYKNAVDLISQDHSRRPACLNNLGNSFRVRFERLGELSDIEHAISILKDAVTLTPRDRLQKPDYLHNLGISFKARFEHLEELSDINDAILMLRDAVDLTPHGHPHKPTFLRSLGSSFLSRFKHLGEPSDIEDAISTLRNAVNLTSPGHPYKPACLHNLGISFVARFKHTGELNDLEEAASILGSALDLTPPGHPYELMCYHSLGITFEARFERLGEQSDLEKAISVYSHAASISIGSIAIRFHASQKWISCARRIRHHSLFYAYSVTIGLLPQLAWIGLSLTHRYRELIQGADVVREAAAAALDLGLPETAVEWLEQGRSIVWGELLQLRSSYEELSSAHPDHARRLRELSVTLEHASTTREQFLSALLEQTQSPVHRITESLQQEADKHRTLAIERDKLLKEIRGFPGFERFLLHKEFLQLCAAPHPGPVVILNAAESRCDALVVLTNVDRVVHVPLPSFNFKRTAYLQNTLKSFLRHTHVMRSDEREGKSVTYDSISWETLLSPMWKCVVKPVLDALAFSTPGDLSRIFWCPTGPFTFLPIHAAGFYDTQYLRPGHKVFDFVISSYIPSLSILALSPDRSAASSGDLCVLAVRQPSSDGLSQLPGVTTELEYIKEVIRNSPSAHTTLLESSVGTVEEVLSLMKQADWVHFACHGIQDATNPTNSGLCLANRRRLKLRDIISLSRSCGGLAFLSACQTATGYEGLSDEAIHIAAGMLFAGYGGVVGTMWSISDKLAPRVARDMYEQLFRNGTRPDYREAARALHEATQRLRDIGNVSFDDWLPFIHIGL